MSMRFQAGINLPGYNPLKVANAPTIGTATAGTSNCASVTFTAPACVGGGSISSYTVAASCGNKVTSGASSPLVVTGLTTGSSYTFKVIATNAYGPSYPSAASNSITATVKTCASYTTAGCYSWVAPSGVTSVAVVAIGGGGGGGAGYNGCCAYGGVGAPGAGLGYKNAYSVTPGNSYTVKVGAGGVGTASAGSTTAVNNSYFVSTAVVKGGTAPYVGDGGGAGGGGGGFCAFVGAGGGGGAGGYSGSGGGGGVGVAGTAGSGGGGGGGGSGYSVCRVAGGGGGTGIFGQGSNGTGGAKGVASPTNCGAGKGGGGGSSGTAGGTSPTYNGNGGAGGTYGGGGGGSAINGNPGGSGGVGAVRIVWCVGGARGTPSFPSTNVGA